jgi:6-phosphogluconolactonase
MSENPSFLALSADRKFLVAINEVDNDDGVGTVESYMVFEDTLILLNRQSSGGGHPCFVNVNKEGYVLAANYTGGNVGLLKLEEDGPLSELMDVQQHTGQGTTDRQEAPHAHSAWFNPIDGDIISIDLGTNELWFSSIDGDGQKLIPATPEKLALNPGDGPRHLTFHPNGKWIYVANELSSSVTRLDRNKDGSYSMGSTVSSLPAGYSEANTCADIHISSDGKFVYVSNRGHNSIAVMKVNEDDGTLKLLGNKGCGGEGPRNFSLSPDENFMLIANQHTNNIVTLSRDPSTGMLKYVGQVQAPTPVCIIF